MGSPVLSWDKSNLTPFTPDKSGKADEKSHVIMSETKPIKGKPSRGFTPDKRGEADEKYYAMSKTKPYAMSETKPAPGLVGPGAPGIVWEDPVPHHNHENV